MADLIVRRETPAYYAARVVWAILWVMEVVLGLRFILRLLAANPAAGFTDFIYRVAHPLMAPFTNIVRSSATGVSGGVVDWSTLLAMVAYWLLAWVIVRLFFLSTSDDRVDYVERM